MLVTNGPSCWPSALVDFCAFPWLFALPCLWLRLHFLLLFSLFELQYVFAPRALCVPGAAVYILDAAGAAASKGLSSTSTSALYPNLTSIRCLHYYYFVSLVPALAKRNCIASWPQQLDPFYGLNHRFLGSDCGVPTSESSVNFH